jgi:serine/threonine protein kinase
MTLESGAKPVPGYTLTNPLGAGAFSEVWEAKHDDGKKLAFKFLDCRKLSPSAIASEVKLLRSLTGLNHPHIIPLTGVHSWGKYLILMMELADGSLDDLYRTYRGETDADMPTDHALDLLEQAAQALDFLGTAKLTTAAGSRGLQHCDIKPSNLLLVGHRLKVADFGLCAGSGWHMHTGWKGTHPYAAPELFNGAAAPGTDQYALAVTYCKMVMGDRAFYKGTGDGRPPAGPPLDFTKMRETEFPVIARALHPYPSSRWPSCKAFIQALRGANESLRKGESLRIFPRGIRGAMRVEVAAAY